MKLSTAAGAHVSLNIMKPSVHVHQATFSSMANVKILTNAVNGHAIVQPFVKIIQVALCARAQTV